MTKVGEAMRIQGAQRRGAAAVEFAVVLPVLFTLMLGTWEVGRIVQVQQVLVNAAREGARLAAQGQTINTFGAYTQIATTTGTPNVRDTVKDYLSGAGFTNQTGVTVTFQFLDGDTSKTQPWQGGKNQRYEVVVTIPYDNVRLTTLNLLGITTLTGRVEWVSMADDPFTINTSIPSWSALP
jgi:Flp pilus assembly protein TadG